MLTEAQYNGGALRITTQTATLTRISPRLIVYASNGGAVGQITLPDLRQHQMLPRDVGGPRFTIIRIGTRQATIFEPVTSTTLATLSAANQAVILTLVDPDAGKWVLRTATVGVPRVFSRTARGAVPEPEDPVTFDPECTFGTPCELADVQPLDGQEGRALVVLPMCHDVRQFATNEDRDPIRVADICPPNRFPVTIRPGQFVKDPLHPHAGVELSDEFWEVFENNGFPHVLEYAVQDGRAGIADTNLRQNRLLGVNKIFDDSGLGRFVTANFKVGQIIDIQGYAAGGYNGLGEIIGVDPAFLTFDAALAFVDDPGDPEVISLEQVGNPVVTSRNPYHLRAKVSGGNFVWSHGPSPIDEPLEVIRHIWKLEIPYQVDDSTYTLRFWLVAEHTCYDQPDLWPGTTATITQAGIQQFADGNYLFLDKGGWLDAGFEKGMRIRITGFGQGGYVGEAWVDDVDDEILVFGGATARDDDGSAGEVTVSRVPGGEIDPDHGLWGTLFMLYAFTDELDPAWVEGATHQPTGFSAASAFTREDPFVSGIADDVAGGTAEDKGCHPHMLIGGALVSTWHDPFLAEHIPLEHRKWHMEIGGGDIPGFNREYDYERPNCAPWVTDADRDRTFCRPCFDGGGASAIGVHRTITFGTTVGGLNSAAMSLGGDCPISEINDHLCLENGQGVGRTYLIPEHPGWDEEVGRLLEDEPSARVTSCIREDWSRFETSCCHGHPEEPFEGIGGSHRCFKNAPTGGPTSTQCCITVYDPTALFSSQDRAGTALAWAGDVCTQDITVYGEQVGMNCEEVGNECKVAGWYYTQRVLIVNDYDYQHGGNPDLREIDYARWLVHPDTALEHYTYDPGDVGDLVAEVGTFDVTGATIIVDAVSAAETLTAVLLYAPAGYTYRDLTVSATTVTALSHSHALAARLSVAPGDEATGYVAIIYLVSGTAGKAEIWRLDAGVKTVLAEADITLDDDAVDMVFQVWGNELILSWSVAGANQGSLTAFDCAYTESGHAGVATTSGSPGAEFADFILLDQSTIFEEVQAEVFKTTQHILFPAVLRISYGQCEGTFNPTCGSCCDPPHCNCQTWTYVLSMSTSASWGDPQVTHFGGPLMSECEGVFCGGSWCPGCDECPPPFPCLELALPFRCEDADAEPEQEPLFCRGIRQWCYSPCACDSADAPS